MNIPKLKQTFTTNYKIFQDGKTVVCYVYPIRRISFLNGYLDVDRDENRKYISADHLDLGINPFKGVATFKDKDVFDIEYAKNIARKKAMRAYFQWIKTEYGSTWKEISNLVESRLQFIEQANSKINELTNEIKEMTKED